MIKKSEYTRKKIKKIREEKELTQSFMVHELSITPPAYQKIESGKTQITLDHLEKIALALNEPIESLLDLDTKIAITNPFSQNTSSTISGNIIVNSLPSSERERYENTIETLNNIITKLLNQIDK